MAALRFHVDGIMIRCSGGKAVRRPLTSGETKADDEEAVEQSLVMVKR